MLPQSVGNYQKAEKRFSARGFGSFGQTGAYTDRRTGAPVVIKLLELGEKPRKLPDSMRADPLFPQYTQDRDASLGRAFFVTNHFNATTLAATPSDYASRRQAAVDAAELLLRLPTAHGCLTDRDLARDEATRRWLVLDSGFVFDAETFSPGRYEDADRLAFLAPETAEDLLAKREPTWDQRANVFAFGMVLYRLFSGRLPPSLERGKPPLSWSLSRDDLAELQAPSALGSLLLRCCRADPEKRPDSLKAVLQSLRRLPASFSPTPPGPGPVRRFFRRVAIWLVVLALLFAGLFAGNRYGLDRRISLPLAEAIDSLFIDLGWKGDLYLSSETPTYVRRSLPFAFGGVGLARCGFSINGRPVRPRERSGELVLDPDPSDTAEEWLLVAVHKLDGRRLSRSLPVHFAPGLDPVDSLRDEKLKIHNAGQQLRVQVSEIWSEPLFLRKIGRATVPLQARLVSEDRSRRKAVYDLEIPAKKAGGVSDFEILVQVDGQDSNSILCGFFQPTPVIEGHRLEKGSLLIFGRHLRGQADWVKLSFREAGGRVRESMGAPNPDGTRVEVRGFPLVQRGDLTVEVDGLPSAPYPLDPKQVVPLITSAPAIPREGGQVSVVGSHIEPGLGSEAIWRQGAEERRLSVVAWNDGEALLGFPPGEGEGELILKTKHGPTSPFAMRYAAPVAAVEDLPDFTLIPEKVVPGEQFSVVSGMKIASLVSAGREIPFEAGEGRVTARFPTIHPGEDQTELAISARGELHKLVVSLAFDPMLAALYAYESEAAGAGDLARYELADAGDGWVEAWNRFRSAYLDYKNQVAKSGRGSAMIRADVVRRLVALASDAQAPRALRAECGYMAGWCRRSEWGGVDSDPWPESLALFRQLEQQDLNPELAAFVKRRLGVLGGDGR